MINGAFVILENILINYLHKIKLWPIPCTRMLVSRVVVSYIFRYYDLSFTLSFNNFYSHLYVKVNYTTINQGHENLLRMGR